MGFYIRKSFSFGPLRVNISKSGLGFSAGARGARVGIDSKGRSYVHYGTGGLYYRSFVDGQGRREGSGQHGTSGLASGGVTSTGPAQPIESVDVAEMTPTSATLMLSELRKSRTRHPLPIAFLAVGCTMSLIAGLIEAPLIAIAIAAFVAVGYMWISAWIKRRGLLRVQFHLDPVTQSRYEGMVAAFDQLCSCQRIWLVESKASIRNRKVHAGASTGLSRQPVRPTRETPPGMSTNILPPMIPVGRQTLYIMPDRVLVYDKRSVGAVEYRDLLVAAVTTRFIEDEPPPADASVIDRTWRFVNRNGGPDRRFGGNRQLPVMQYAELRIASDSGLNELLLVSKWDAALAFAAAMRYLAEPSKAI